MLIYADSSISSTGKRKNKVSPRHFCDQNITEPIEIPGKFEQKTRPNPTMTRRAAPPRVSNALREGEHLKATMRAPSDRETRWQNHEAPTQCHTTSCTGLVRELITSSIARSRAGSPFMPQRIPALRRSWVLSSIRTHTTAMRAPQPRIALKQR